MTRFKIAVAAMIITAGAFGTYAFTNANSEKSEFLNTYHYVSENEDGEIIFASGPSTDPNCDDTGEKPCQFTSSSTLTSPMSKEDIELSATVNSWRN